MKRIEKWNHTRIHQVHQAAPDSWQAAREQRGRGGASEGSDAAGSKGGRQQAMRASGLHFFNLDATMAV